MNQVSENKAAAGKAFRLPIFETSLCQILYIGNDSSCIRDLMKPPSPEDPIHLVFSFEKEMCHIERRLEAERFNLIILDMDIRDEDPVKRLEAISDWAPDTPILVLFRDENEEAIQRGIQSGAQEYAAKSGLTWENLLCLVNHAIHRWKAQDSFRRQRMDIHQMRQEHQAIIQSTPNGLCILNPDWSIRWMNHTMARLICPDNPDSQDLLGLYLHELFSTRDDFHEYYDLALQGIRNQGIDVRDWKLRRLDETMFAAEITLVRLDPSQTDPGFLITIVDMTDRMTARERLQQTKDDLQMIYDGMVDGLMIADCEMRRILRANPAVTRILGYSEEEIMSKYVDDLHPSDSLPMVLKLFEDITQGKVEYAANVPFLHKDGSIRHVDISAHKFLYNNKSCCIAFFSDSTEQYKMREKLGVSEKELSLMVEQIPAILWTTDRMLRIKTLKGAGLVGLQLNPEIYIGKAARNFILEIDESLSLVMQIDKALQGESSTIESENGERTFQNQIEPLRDSNGAIIGVVAFSLDVSERKRLLRELIHEERLAAIGGAMDSIAHCMKNLLTVMQGGMGVFQKAIQESDIEMSARAFYLLNKSSRRLHLVIMNMLDYSSLNGPIIEETSLSKLFEEVILMLEHLATGNICFASIVERDADKCRIDSQKLFRALLNLGSNAIDAMPLGGKIRIGARRINSEDPYWSRACQKQPALQSHSSALLIEMEDTGKGIPPHVYEKLFTPFFTTKGSKGTGLGLASVKHFMDVVGGAITVDTNEGVGTIFRLFLPETHSAAQQQQNL